MFTPRRSGRPHDRPATLVLAAEGRVSPVPGAILVVTLIVLFGTRQRRQEFADGPWPVYVVALGSCVVLAVWLYLAVGVQL